MGRKGFLSGDITAIHLPTLRFASSRQAAPPEDSHHDAVWLKLALVERMWKPPGGNGDVCQAAFTSWGVVMGFEVDRWRRVG